MKAQDHNKVIGIGFGVFAAIFGFTFGLLMLVSLGVFLGMGLTSGDNTQARIGLAGGIFAVIFYLVLGAIFVLPTAMAGWKTFKCRPGARIWGTIAAILVVGVAPLGTALGVYALWFFFSGPGKQFYAAGSEAAD